MTTKDEEPPLISEERIETDAKTNTTVRIVSRERGVWPSRRATTTPSSRLFEEQASQSPRTAIEEFCDDIRNHLEKSGLPSDRTPVWIRENNGPWEPHRNPDGSFRRTGAQYQRWIKRLESLTAPLSKHRTAGEFLDALTI